jgi:hypothetical protein
MSSTCYSSIIASIDIGGLCTLQGGDGDCQCLELRQIDILSFLSWTDAICQ